MLYSQVKISLPKLKVNEYSFINFKCNNKHINEALRHLIYHGYDKTSFKTWCIKDTHSTQSKASFIKWPISPKVKETHFKIINNIYPVGQLLKKGLNLRWTSVLFVTKRMKLFAIYLLNVATPRTFGKKWEIGLTLKWIFLHWKWYIFCCTWTIWTFRQLMSLILF